MSTTPDVWAPSEAKDRSASAGGAPGAGAGDLPPVVKLLMDSIDDLKANFMGHLLLGLALMAVTVPAVLIIVTVAMTPLMVGVIGEIDWLVLGGFAWYVVALFGGMALISGPPTIALLRAANAHLDGEEGALSFGAYFGALFTGLGGAILLGAIIAGLSFVGLMMCYVPILVVSAATSFAYPAHVVHGLGPIAAIQRSAVHFKDHLSWHIGFWALGFAILMVAGNVPLIGYAIGMPLYAVYTMRGYRAAFGSGRDE